MKYLKLYESYEEYNINDLLDHMYGKGSIHLVHEICLTNRGLTSLIGLNRMPNLQHFRVPRNNLTSLEGIENLENLGFFSCIKNKITSLKGIEHCKALYHLGCYDNELKNLDEIKDLPKLRELNCEINDDGEDATNPWELPLPKEMVDKFQIVYSNFTLQKFGDYEFQKEFIEEHPMKVKDLEPVGFNNKIIEEYKELLEFFNIEL